MNPKPNFAANRERLLDRMAEDEALLLFGAPHHIRNGDAEFRFRQNSDLYWLSGWEQPQVALFIRPGEDPFTLFVQPKDRTIEIWTGYRPGPEGAIGDYGADVAYEIGELPAKLPSLLSGVSKLHYAFAEDHDNDAILMGSIRKAAREFGRKGAAVPETFIAPTKLLHELRLIKDPAEIATLQRAADITSEAHIDAMRRTQPGQNEYEVEAALQMIFRQRGGNGAGYTPIVAGGSNACILHYIENNQVLNDGDLLLIDAGCEYEFYTADVTRTFPVNGTFTGPQRDIYELVLASQIASIDAMRVGRPYSEYGEAALHVLVEGLIDLGLINGSFEESLEEKLYRRFYMHGIGHWLGLDVHDVGAYGRDGASRPLLPGMVLTVEPGLYIPEDDETVPEAFRGIGVRIEDNILIHDDGPRNLTASAPKTVEDIEALCKEA